VTTIDDRIAALAAANDNIVERNELLRLGATDKQIRTRRRRRQLRTLHAGVYLFGAAEPTWRQRVRAGTRAASRGAMASSGTVLALRGIDGAIEGQVEVMVRRDGGPTPRGVRVHRPRRAVLRPQFVDGIPVTPIERALLDYASAASVELVERAVESALLKRLTTEERIWLTIAEFSCFGCRGTGRLKGVMTNRPEGKPARSVLEILVLDLLRKRGVPLPIRNHDVMVDGKPVAEIDLAFVARLFALEADGAAFHSTSTQRKKDKARQKMLEALGWTFLRVTWFDLVTRPDWIVSQVRAALGVSSAA
jgi:hypothetical protein